MSGLNPWFKTIINTLAKRLRATNARVKELESNSASVNYGTGKHSGYEFFKSNDVIKVLGTFFLVYKSHGERHAKGIAIHRKTMDLYMRDIYGVIESKLDEMILILTDLGLMEIEDDKDGLPKVLVLRNLELIRSFFIFYNTEKHLTEDKKLKINKKCQIFLEKIWTKVANIEEDNSGLILAEISDLLKYWEDRGEAITIDVLEEAREHGIVGEVIVGEENNLSVEVNLIKLRKLLPNIQFMNRVLESNQQKSTVA